MNKTEQKTQIRAAIRVRYLAPTNHAGSRYSVQDDRPSDNDSWRMIVSKDDGSSTPEADAAQAWLDRFINSRERRSVAVLHPVAVRWGRDTFFTWDYEDAE